MECAILTYQLGRLVCPLDLYSLSTIDCMMSAFKLVLVNGSANVDHSFPIVYFLDCILPFVFMQFSFCAFQLSDIEPSHSALAQATIVD